MQITKMVTLRNYKEDDQQDCNGDHAAMARIWCDLHCVRSAVEDGDEAILTSLEGAVKVIDTNVDLLTEYYNGLVSDKVDTVLEAIDELKTMAKPKHQELAELQAGMHRSFGEMKRLAVGLDQTGREAFLRAIDHFKAADGDFSPNATALRFLSDRTDLLHNALKNANAKHKLSQKNAVSQRTAEAAAAMQQLARSRNYLLGVYEHRATRSKERQNRISQDAQGKYNQALSAIGRQLSRLEQYAQRQILADLDSSWWPLRAAFDAYLHAAELQANAFRSAADVLQDYHQCSADFATLRQSYASVQATQQKTHEVLSQTWSTAVTLTGLLVSKLVDSNAFAELAMGEARASLGHVDLCQPEGLSFASAALNSSWYEGLAGQTVRQLTVVFAELGMLKEHLDDLGMEPEDLDVVANAFRRSIELVQTADMAKTSQAKELLADSGCPSEG